MKNHRSKPSVNELLETAGQENWDGEDALPADPGTVQLAERFADLLPISIDPPHVYASPVGEINFEWFVSKDVMLTVSVCPSEEIAFAGIFNDLEIHGEKSWAEGDPLPSPVLNCFDMLRKTAVSETR